MKQAEKASSEQSKRLAEREKQIVGLQAKVQHIMDENKVLKNDLQRFRNRISEQGNEIKGITNQLQQQQQYTDDLKENSLIKDAEVSKFFFSPFFMIASFKGFIRKYVGLGH